MKVDVHRLRKAGASDQAILDLLRLIRLGLAPSRRLNTTVLRDLWSCSQPQVSRRMKAIASLGVCIVRSSWHGYYITDERPAKQPLRLLPPKTDPAVAASRWEDIRRRFLSARQA